MMRYIVNANNYVTAVSFGALLNYADCDCTEYTGKIPSGWDSLEKWYEDEGNKLWRWKIINGNLVYNASAVAPEEGEWGKPNLQDKMISGMIFGQTVVKPDEGFDGLSSVTIAAQPGWKSIEAGTGQALTLPYGAEMWINNGTDQIPSVILLECTAMPSSVLADQLTVSSMRLELTDGEITSMNATISMNGYLVKGTNFHGMSVTLSDGVLKICCNTETCKFYYDSTSPTYVFYRCYIMYGDTGSMKNNGAVNGSINGITTTEFIIPEGYTTGGKVTFDDTKIIEMLNSI